MSGWLQGALCMALLHTMDINTPISRGVRIARQQQRQYTPLAKTIDTYRFGGVQVLGVQFGILRKICPKFMAK